jgi:FkbM family methyltransferase
MNLSAIPRRCLVGRLLRAPLRLVPRTAVVPVIQGPLHGTRWIVGSGNHGYWLGWYESNKVRRFAAAIFGTRVVYDVGANVGYYSVLASRVLGSSGQVIAFEPDPQNIAFLRRHLEMNGIENVQVVEAAVSDCCGEAMFQQEASRYMGALSQSGTLPVRILSLDELISSGELPPPDVIKIDVEGAEQQVLLGAEQTLRPKHPLLFVATHTTAMHWECCQFLKSLDYKLEAIDGSSLECSREIIAH